MALEALIARLEADADARLSQHEASAAAEARALLDEARQVESQRREQELSTRRARRRARLDTALAQARRDAKQARLLAQHALLERVFSRARALLPELASTPAFLERLPGQLEEAQRYLEGVPVVVRAHPSILALLPRTGATFVEDPSMPPGVVVSAADGSVFIDNTLPARLQRLAPRLGVELLASLEVTA